MRWPRLSVGATMAVLVVVAADFAVFRSFWTRPHGGGELTWFAWATLPMANLLTLGAARLARGRISGRPALAGFEVGGWSALVATPFLLEPVLDRLEEALESLGLVPRIYAIVPESVIDGGMLVGLPFLAQVLVGLACGWLARRLASRLGPAPAAEAGPGRRSLRPLVVLVALAAIPAVAVEAYLARRVDPITARLAEGSLAVITLSGPGTHPGFLPPNPAMLRLGGALVRVESDTEPNLLGLVKSPGSPPILVDARSIRARVAEGPKAGEVVYLPRCLLRPAPPRSGRVVESGPSAEGPR